MKRIANVLCGYEHLYPCESGSKLCVGLVLCQGQVIKEGQVVCYLEQLGTQQPVEVCIVTFLSNLFVRDGHGRKLC